MDDQELINRYQGGDQKAFNEIYRRYKDRISWFFYKRISQKHLVEDLVQDTFLRLIRFANTYEKQKGAKFSTWLYEIAKGVLYSRWQYDKAKSRDRPEVSIDEDPDHRRKLELISPTYSPEQLTDHSIGMQIYQKRLANMPEQFAEVYELYVHNFTYEEIATITNSPVNTVKSRIHRARTQLL